jgi:hypothetical protein
MTIQEQAAMLLHKWESPDEPWEVAGSGWREEVRKIADRILALVEAEREEYQRIFDLQQTRMSEAVQIWQKAAGKHGTIPDLGGLLSWLLAERDDLRRKLEELEQHSADLKRCWDLSEERYARLQKEEAKARLANAALRTALDAAQTVLSDIYKREGKSFHGSRVKADIESIMPVVDAALALPADELAEEVRDAISAARACLISKGFSPEEENGIIPHLDSLLAKLGARP